MHAKLLSLLLLLACCFITVKACDVHAQRNHAKNQKCKLHSFEWCRAIIRGGVDGSAHYAVSSNQLSFIRKIVNQEVPLAEFRKVLKFQAQPYLVTSDARGQEFMITLTNEKNEDGCYIYDVTLSYLLYDQFGSKRLTKSSCYFFAELVK
jgi:hypothetical protein